MEEKKTPDKDFDENHRFKKGNSFAFGNGLPKDKIRGQKTGAKVKRLTTYLRRHLETFVKDHPEFKKFQKDHGDKTVANLFMHRVLEEALKNPTKAHPLVRDILNRIDGVLTPEIEVDPDTPVTVVKFVVVNKREDVEIEVENERN